MRENDNRKRALADVVTVDAWHDPFGPKVQKANLHVDVVFLSARVGGDDTSVRFRLRLKKAEVIVIIPASEPARVDKTSVSRDAPTLTAKATETRKTNRKTTAAAKVKAQVEPNTLKGCGGAELGTSLASSHDTVLTITQSLKTMTVVQSQTADGDYRWTVEAGLDSVLAGRPWDATVTPRLAVLDTRGDRSKGIEPTIRVEVRCRREDLEITDIVLKDRDRWQKVSQSMFRRNKLAAAEALIRTRLFEEGLMTGDPTDPFAHMTLASIAAESA